MHSDPYIVLGSAIIGLLVGMTGAGGGALMTPMLILLFGAPEQRRDEWARERRRIFLEIASPQASENKRMVYSERDPARRREDFERMRRATDDLEALRERLRFTLALRS